MAVLVLVHGGSMSTETWNRLTTGAPVHTEDGRMGARIWDPVVPLLAAHGHRVFTPALIDEHCTDLTGHILQLCTLIADRGLTNLVLAGHSYGGMVITGAAARLEGRVRHLVYIDAALPAPGQSLFDLIAAAGIDPFSCAGLEPAPPYTEKLQFDPRDLEPVGKTYVYCTESDFVRVSREALKTVAGVPGWTFMGLPSSHVPMAEMPDEVAWILLDAVKRAGM